MHSNARYTVANGGPPQQYANFIIQQPQGAAYSAQPVYHIASAAPQQHSATPGRGAPSYTPASSSSGFSQHLQQHAVSPQQRPSPPPQQSSLARAVYRAKTSAVLDALPDDDVRRLFVVMFEKYATQVVASQVQARREIITKKRDEAKRAAAAADKEEVSAQLAGVVSMLDDDDDY